MKHYIPRFFMGDFKRKGYNLLTAPTKEPRICDAATTRVLSNCELCVVFVLLLVV